MRDGQAAWLQGINIKDYLSEEEIAMIETIGIENFLTLVEKFNKTHFYFTDRRLKDAKKAYIRTQKDRRAKDLARELNLAESTVYAILNETRNEDPNLFE